jgi:protein-S-isoprenylcysteine O-methyltransferase Ste14
MASLRVYRVELVILIKQNKNKMDKLKKYKTQIFNAITIFLIVTFAIYPGLTTANTLLNILAGIGLLLLIVWGGLALYAYARSSEELVEESKPIEAVKQKRKPKTK